MWDSAACSSRARRCATSNVSCKQHSRRRTPADCLCIIAWVFALINPKINPNIYGKTPTGKHLTKHQAKSQEHQWSRAGFPTEDLPLTFYTNSAYQIERLKNPKSVQLTAPLSPWERLFGPEHALKRARRIASWAQGWVSPGEAGSDKRPSPKGRAEPRALHR